MERTTIDISWISLWRILFFALLVGIMFLGRQILEALFLALVISSGLEFIVNFLERKRIPRTIGVILIFLMVALALIIVVYTLIPLLIVEINTAFLTLGTMGGDAWWKPFFTIEATESFNSFLARISGQLFGEGSSPFQAFSQIFGGFALAISAIVSSFYLSLSRDGGERFIRAVFPTSYEETVLRIYHRAVHRVGLWFRAQILLSIIVGLMVLVALLILGVKYAVLIAILTAILEIVPYIGPMIAGGIALAAAFVTSPSLVVYTMLAFLVIQQIENHILIPLLVGRGTGLHPVIVIMALLIGLEAGGILGMIIAVPLAVVAQEIVGEWTDRKRSQVTAPTESPEVTTV